MRSDMTGRPSPATQTAEPVVVDLSKPGIMKPVGGAKSDAWNSHFFGKLVAALPNGTSPDRRGGIIVATTAGQVDIKPSDPVEAMLSGQMIAANEAALDMYRRAWIDDQRFDVRTKYLALADKAARTVATLAEALDRHRSRGRQQITVKHVTVNADQAIVADQVTTGSRSPGGGGDYNGNGGQPHAKALAHAPGTPLCGEVETVRETVPLTRR